MKATAAAWNRETIEAKLGAPISEEEYNLFVEPFEGITRLEAIRASLRPDKIVEPAKISASKTRISDFPDNISFSNHDVASFKGVHSLLANLERSSFGQQNTDTLVQQHKLENQRTHILRFLWIIGNYGKFEKDASQRLVVEAEKYVDNRGSEKTLAIWSFVEDVVFKVLREFGVCCERFALRGMATEDLTTGTGYLRKKGWAMQVSFEEKVGGEAALKALQTYVQRLDKKYGAKAFRRFRNADMQVLL